MTKFEKISLFLERLDIKGKYIDTSITTFSTLIPSAKEIFTKFFHNVDYSILMKYYESAIDEAFDEEDVAELVELAASPVFVKYLSFTTQMYQSMAEGLSLWFSHLVETEYHKLKTMLKNSDVDLIDQELIAELFKMSNYSINPNTSTKIEN